MQNTCSRLYYRTHGSLNGERTMKTVKPTENELEIAIVAAEQELDGSRDAHHVAAALVYLYRRQQDLEMIRDAAEKLVLSGQDEGRLAALQAAIDSARKNEARRGG